MAMYSVPEGETSMRCARCYIKKANKVDGKHPQMETVLFSGVAYLICPKCGYRVLDNATAKP